MSDADEHDNPAFDEGEADEELTPDKENGAVDSEAEEHNNMAFGEDEAEEDLPQDKTNGVVDPEDTRVDITDDEKLERIKQREVLYFKDGIRRIDYILVYEDTNDQKNSDKREAYENNLRNEGVDIERETKKDSVDGKSYFLKLHITWETLMKVAELLYIPKRIKMSKTLQDAAESHDCWDSCSTGCTVGAPIIEEEDEYFTSEFDSNNLLWFDIDENDPGSFFTNAERSLCAKEILDRTTYTPQHQEGASKFASSFGINRLLDEGVYSGAFPLHEGPYEKLPDDDTPFTGQDKDRLRLYESWARPGRWYCYQPLDLVRKYFGEKVGIYFAWLGFYTAMLIPASVIGLFVFIYGIVTVWSSIPSEEICNDKNISKIVMCPDCDTRCKYWYLEETCIYSRLTYVFDNEATLFFAAFMAIWSTIFLEFWKRKQKSLEYDWDVADFELEEPVRPEYEYKITSTKTNPITLTEEPFMPWYSKFPRTCTSFGVVLFMIALVVATIVGVIIYRIIIVVLIYEVQPNETIAKLGASISASVINLVCIVVLNLLYTKLAEKLTDLEVPRTWTEYEDSLTFKMFMFQFVNFYGSIFYIAFFKGRFSTLPGIQENYFFGKWRQDTCDPSGCLVDLFIQLGIIMVGKQTLNNFKEFLLPKLMAWYSTRKSQKNETSDNLYMRWEQDLDLADPPNLGLFEEYLEMVIQYGFVTIFVAAFPLAPLFALLNNIIEIRLDAYKFVCTWKRGPAMKAQNIGVWYGILKAISFIAVVTNAFIIGWTSDFIPKMVYMFQVDPATDTSVGTLHGYVDFSLSRFNISHYPNATAPVDAPPPDTTFCRFRGFREVNAPYDYTKQYWIIFTARLAFIIVFEHAVFIITWIVSYVIPDVPASVKRLQLYERELLKKMRFDATMSNSNKRQ